MRKETRNTLLKKIRYPLLAISSFLYCSYKMIFSIFSIFLMFCVYVVIAFYCDININQAKITEELSQLSQEEIMDICSSFFWTFIIIALCFAIFMILNGLNGKVSYWNPVDFTDCVKNRRIAIIAGGVLGVITIIIFFYLSISNLWQGTQAPSMFVRNVSIVTLLIILGKCLSFDIYNQIYLPRQVKINRTFRIDPYNIYRKYEKEPIYESTNGIYSISVKEKRATKIES